MILRGKSRCVSDQVHSDTLHNADGADHMYALVFEELRDGGDRDSSDFVVMMESVTPVCVPGAILLGQFIRIVNI